MSDTSIAVVSALFSLISILLSITLHEVAHGYTAYKLGDSTAKAYGRLSLNPFAHINPAGFGLLALLIVLSSFSGQNSGFVMSMLSVVVCFTFAKPVPVGGRGLKKPLRDMAIISVSGPIANIVLAFVAMVIIKYIILFARVNSEFAFNAISMAIYFLGYLAQLNIGLAVFNLLPIPPLDGSKILYPLLPKKALVTFVKYEKYITLALLLMLVFDLLDMPLNFLGNTVYKGLDFLVGLLPPR